MNPVVFRLPFLGLPTYSYGIMTVICILIGAFVATIEAKRRGENPDHIWDGLILVIIFGLIGARLYHVISSPGASCGALITTASTLGGPGYYSTR